MTLLIEQTFVIMTYMTTTKSLMNCNLKIRFMVIGVLKVLFSGAVIVDIRMKLMIGNTILLTAINVIC